MSKIKYSKTFIQRSLDTPRTYIIHRSFHEDYDILHRWFHFSDIEFENETKTDASHVVTFSEEVDSKFTELFGENVYG